MFLVKLLWIFIAILFAVSLFFSKGMQKIINPIYLKNENPNVISKEIVILKWIIPNFFTISLPVACYLTLFIKPNNAHENSALTIVKYLLFPLSVFQFFGHIIQNFKRAYGVLLGDFITISFCGIGQIFEISLISYILFLLQNSNHKNINIIRILYLLSIFFILYILIHRIYSATPYLKGKESLDEFNKREFKKSCVAYYNENTEDSKNRENIKNKKSTCPFSYLFK